MSVILKWNVNDRERHVVESQSCGFGATTGRTMSGKASACGADASLHILTPKQSQ